VTNNKVAGHPVPTKLLHRSADYDPALLPEAEALSRVFRASSSNGNPFGNLPPPGSKAYASTVSSPVLQATLAHVAAQVGVPVYPPGDMAAACRGCQILRGALRDNGASLVGEPQWRGCLQLSAFVENGEYWAHELSRGNAYYDEASTQAKFEGILADKEAGKITAPHVCTTMETIYAGWTVQRPPPWGELDGPSHAINPCEGCSFRGQVTTPLQTAHAYANLTDGFVAKLGGPSTGVYRRVEDPVSGKVDYNRISSWAPTSIKLAEHPVTSKGSLLILETVDPSGKVDTTEINLNELHNAAKTADKVQGLGLDAPQGAQSSALRQSFMNMRVSKRAQGDTIVLLDHMGWRDDLRAFAIGDQLLVENHKVLPAIYQNDRDRAISGNYITAGNPDDWQKAATLFTTDPRPEVHAMIAAAFASPLAQLSLEHNLLTSFYSQGSGVGKTTLMRLAASVWGSRKTVKQSTDTATAIQATLKQIYSMPLLWDEFARGTIDDQKVLADFLFRFVEGSEKSRGTVTGGLQLSGEWQTLMMLAGNFSVLNMMPQASNDEAGMARVLEFELTAVAMRIAAHLTQGVFTENYGWAGRLMVIHILKNRDYVRQVLRAADEQLRIDLGDDPRNRILYATGAAIITAAHLVRKFQILPLHCGLVRDAVIAAIKRSTISIANFQRATNGITLLGKYVSEHQHRMVVFPLAGGMQGVAGAPNYLSPRNDKLPVVIEHNAVAQTVTVNRNEFVRWLKAGQHNPDIRLRDIQGTQGASLNRAVLAGQTPFVTASMDVITVPSPLVGL
jgi:hypothetical protein